MKTEKLLKVSLLSIVIILSSCKKDSPTPVVNNIDEDCTVETPATYAFTFDGVSTVAYNGQAARLETANSVYSVLNADPEQSTTTITRAELDLIIDNTNSKLINKTAENSVNRGVVIGHLNGILDTYCANSAAYDLGTIASAGTAGLYDGYQLDENGWEADQQFAKMLIGSLCLEQVIQS